MERIFSYTSYCLLLCFYLLQTSCTPDLPTNNQVSTNQYSADVANEWYAKAIEITPHTPGFTANVSARAMGYMGLALYESVVNGMEDYRSLSGSLDGFVLNTSYIDQNLYTYHWGAAANSAMAYMLKNLYPNMPDTDLQSVDELEQSWKEKFAEETDLATLTRSVNIGRQIAEAVFEWSSTDGGHEAYLYPTVPNFVPVAGPGRWTPPTTTKPLHPYWGNNRPFWTINVASAQPAPPKNYSEQMTSPFYFQAKEVYNTVNALTDEQKTIANYWADDLGTMTTAGHLTNVLRQVLIQEKANLSTAAEAYAKLGMGMNDALIACWKCKYENSLMRPAPYIQSHINANWQPIVAAPATPEYTSEHGAQAGVLSKVLTQFFGDNYAFNDTTYDSAETAFDGSLRYYISFDDLANEAAFSRLYGGVHFRDAVMIGLAQGKIVGSNVNAMPFLENN